MKNLNYLNCHFHKVDSLCWLQVKSWLSHALVERVEVSCDVVPLQISADMWGVFMDFLEQMDTAYLHPRRDAAHLKACECRYSGFSSTKIHRASHVSE